MKPNPRFLNLPKPFWAIARTISQDFGYTARRRGQSGEIAVPTIAEMAQALSESALDSSLVLQPEGKPTELGGILQEYFQYRADMLNGYVEPRLMDATQARAQFRKLRAQLQPRCPIPMNKQKGKKKGEAYLTGLVNMIVEANAEGIPCDFDPQRLTTITRDGVPVRTLARRIDGAFPGTVNPVAVWEIKEYYHTTTFGSRVADGVYETLLDGMELAELREHEGIHVLHYMILDAHYTWWECGRSYLCRVLDALHMGYVDEVLFGHEVIERLPGIVKSWVQLARKRVQENVAQRNSMG